MKQARAFSIVELLTVVVIISILLLAAGLGINRARSASRDAERLGDVSLIAQALDQSMLTERSYPRHAENNGALQMCAHQAAFKDRALSLFPGNKVPTDPQPKVRAGNPCSSTREGYLYVPNDGDYAYSLYVSLESEAPYDQTAFVKTGMEDGRHVYRLNGPLR